MKVVMHDTGKIKEVADGYARNYLFPRQLAKAATREVIQAAEIKHQAQKNHVSELVAAYEQLRKKLLDMQLQISAKANETGTLFASISPEQISAELRNTHQLEIDPAFITTSEPIKHVGKHTVTVRLPEIDAIEIELNVQNE